ncbi:MAG: murein hydrolase activator EnvC [Hyphomonadaceae bacterium]
MAKGALSACLAALLAASLAFPENAPAQTRRTGATAAAARNAEAAERARADAVAAAQRARAEARAAQADLASLDRRLAEAAARQAEARAAAEAADLRRQSLEAEAREANRLYERRRGAAENLVIAALFAERSRQPLGRHGAAQASAFARAAGPAFLRQTAGSASQIAQNRRQAADVAEEERLLAEAQAALAAEQEGVQALAASRRAERTTLLASAAEAERRARRHAAEARSLRELAARVQPARRQNAAAQTRTPNSRAPALGQLRPPVSGPVILAYGQRNAAGHAATGVTYRAAAGADVVAPASGTVGYAGLFRSYGQILILNLDNGYVLVLAGMNNVSPRAGQTIQAGQIVGQMARAAQTPPELYVEVRRDGRPVDPSRQLASRAL